MCGPRDAALLASTAIAALSLANPALANCDITGSPNTVICSTNTTTTDTTNTDGGSASSPDRFQLFTTGGNVTGLIGSGVTIDGAGLSIKTSEDGASLTFTNSGTLNENSAGSKGSSAGLGLQGIGDITYNSANGATVTASNDYGLLLEAQGSASTPGDLTAHINGNIDNTRYTGVSVTTPGTGRILIDGIGSITGGTAGITVAQVNESAAVDGDITISGSGNVTGSSAGIYVMHRANAGTVTIDRTGTITTASGYGIQVIDTGTGGVSITGVGDITMTTGTGIYVTGSSGVTIAPAGKISAGSGIYSAQSGTGTSLITIANDVSTGASSLIINTVDGANTLNITGGTIYSSGSTGVSLDASGSGDITVNMTGGQIGESAANPVSQYGIQAQKTGASGDINVTSGTVFAGINGIVLSTANGSTSSINLTANSTVAGQPASQSVSTAIYSNVRGSGTNTITVNGDVSSQTAPGIIADSLDGAITIVNNARVATAFSGRAAIEATSTTGAISITNNATGLLTTDLAVPEQGNAIRNYGGSTTLNNLGTIVGRISFANGANIFDNSGTWVAASVNNFNSGSTAVTNSGTITLRSGATIIGTNIAITNTAGTLTDDGTINGTVTINGGVLGGTGTIVGTTTINNGGVLAPGNSIGTFRVTGDLVFGAGGIYRVEASSTAADQTLVTGTATLTGATVAATISSFTIGQSQAILTAAGGLGGTTFASLSTNGTLIAHLDYDANNVYLVVDSTSLVSGLAPGTQNQRGIADTINTAISGGAASGNFAALYALSGAGLGQALDQLSGEAATSSTTTAFQTTSQFLSLMTSPFGGTPGNNVAGTARGYAEEAQLPAEARAAYAEITPKDRRSSTSFSERWGVWGATYGGASKTGGDSSVLGSHDVNARDYGIVAGADYRFSSDTALGFAVGGGASHASLSDNLGNSDSDIFQLGAYGRHRIGAAYVAGALSYGLHRVSTERTVTVSGSDRLTADFNGQSFAGRLESGYRFTTAIAGITPYAAVEAQSFHTPSYSESATSGSNAFALAFSSRTTNNLRTELGAWFDKAIDTGSSTTLALKARAAWVHDSDTTRAANAAFQTLTGSNFTVYGAEAPKDSALLSAGTDLRFANNAVLSTRLDGQFAAGAHSFTAQAVLQYRW
ncbi:MAG: autotransporter domain-containing protein [Rhodopseudomonas sp.]|nr:autotransporter domain-containing protein [Rhodopseudomonas sp.]